jgi:hypothetical protein
MELSGLYGIEIELLNKYSDSAIRCLYQYHGVKLAYENAKKVMVKKQDSIEVYYLKCRTDIYIDKIYANLIARQLHNQLPNEVAFCGSAFGCGLNDFIALSGPACADKVFSVVDGFAELYARKYVVCPEVGLKLYIEKHDIPFSINRRLLTIPLRKADNKLVKLHTIGLFSRNLAQHPMSLASGKNYTRWESLKIGIIESLKSIPVDWRISYCLWRRNRNLQHGQSA